MQHDVPSPFAPLPGTEPTPRGLFVDRWGTLLELPERGLCARFSEARFVEGTVDALFRAQQAGWRIYLIGNEDAVARGRLAESTWKTFEQELLAHLAARGVDVVRNYACLHHPEGKGERCKNSVFRLPETGLLYHALQVDGIVLPKSWVIGDSTLELAAGSRAGCQVAGVRSGLGLSDDTLDIDPDMVVTDLTEALGILTAAISVSRR